jgi:DNA-binding transcriptional MerR regulator/methylmalonyl-CoA mutase cobalamin-binding subunit
MADAAARTDAGAGPFRIQAAAELSGVAAATLRAWERRYGVPAPRRTASAYRLYTADDVAQVRRMRDLVEEGVSPAEAARVVLGSPAAVSADERVPIDGLELAHDRILAATQRWDGPAIDRELMRLSMMLDAHTMFERVVAPVLVEVGARWERGEMSIAQEHLVCERLELPVRASLRTLERSDGPLVLLACVDAEQHVLGLLGAALRFASSGARTVVLGAMTPPSAIADAVRSMAPRLVGLSLAQPLPPATARALFRAYGKACGSTPWVVGGAATAELQSAVEAAGGIAAIGPSSAWSAQIRDWLRSAR